MVRLMRGKIPVAPVPRLDHFDFAIYYTLGADWIKVAEEQHRYMALKQGVEAATVALQDAIQAATGTAEQSEPGDPAQALLQHDAADAAATDGDSQEEGVGDLRREPDQSALPKPTDPVTSTESDRLGGGGGITGGSAGRALVVHTVASGGGGLHTCANAHSQGHNQGQAQAGLHGRGSASPDPADQAAGRQRAGASPRAHTHVVPGGRRNLGGQAALHAGRCNAAAADGGDGGDGGGGGGRKKECKDPAPGPAPPRITPSSTPTGRAPGASPAVPSAGLPGGDVAVSQTDIEVKISAGPPQNPNPTDGDLRPSSLEVASPGMASPGFSPTPPPLPTPPSKKASGLFIRARLRQTPPPPLEVSPDPDGAFGGIPCSSAPSSRKSLYGAARRVSGSGDSAGSAGVADVGAPGGSPTGGGGGSTYQLLSADAQSGIVDGACSTAQVTAEDDLKAAPSPVSPAPQQPRTASSPRSPTPFLPLLHDSKPPWATLRVPPGGAPQPAAGSPKGVGGGSGGSIIGGMGRDLSLPPISRPTLKRAETARVHHTQPYDNLPGPVNRRARMRYSMDGCRPLLPVHIEEDEEAEAGDNGKEEDIGRDVDAKDNDRESEASMPARPRRRCSNNGFSGNGGVPRVRSYPKERRRMSYDGAGSGGAHGEPGGVLAGLRQRPAWRKLSRAASDALLRAGRASEPCMKPGVETAAGAGGRRRLSCGPSVGASSGAGGAALRSSAPQLQGVAIGGGAASPASPSAQSRPGAAGPSPRPPPGGPPANHIFRCMSLLRHAASLQIADAPSGAAANATGASSPNSNIISPEAAARIEQLRSELQSKLEELHRCSQLISVFLNRSNAAWAEAQTWGPPASVSQLQLSAFARSETGMVFRNELLRMLRCGAIAVHLRAADDFLEPGFVRTARVQQADGNAGGSSGGVVSSSSGGGSVGDGGDADDGIAAPQPPPRPVLMSTVSVRWPGVSAVTAAVTATAGGGSTGGDGTTAAAVTGGGGGASKGGYLGLPGLMYRSTAPDLWTHDPWKMLEAHRPGMVLGGARLDGVPLGCRYVASLVLALESLAGREAVERLPLLLAVSAEQQDEVVRQLWGFRFFGIPRENVVVLVQPSHPGYAYDSAARTWHQGDAGHSLPLGSGYGLMQLAWRGEAMGISEEGCLAPLPLSALSWMEARGVTWMISRRARDLSLLGREGVLDVNSLSYGLYHHTDRCPDTNIILEAQTATNLLLSRALDSVVLSRKLDPAPSDSTPLASAAAAPEHQSPPQQPAQQQPAQQPPHQQHQVVELCHADLATPALRSVLSDYAAGGRVMAGLGRYTMHLPSVARMLAGRLSVLRPKLALVDALLHLRLELADLTSAPSACPLLLQARPDSPQLLVHDDVEALLPLLQAQDNNSTFRQLIMSCRAAAVGISTGAGGPPAAGPSPLASFRLKHPGAQRILVYVVANNVSSAAVAMAASLARPGRDTVTLATVVSDGGLFRERAEGLLARHAAAFEKLCAATYACAVVERGAYGLIDCMENYATQQDATLVVIGSNSLTSNATTGASSSAPSSSSSSSAAADSAASTASLIRIVGSVTLALLRRMPMPLLLVTRASAAATAAASAAAATAEKEGRRRAVRMMGVLEGQGAKGMLDFLAGKLFNPTGGDQLLLSYVRPTANMTRQQQANVKALINRYLTQVAGHCLRPAATLLLDGPMDRCLAAAVAEHSIDLLALPAPGPRGSQVPPLVVSTLRAANAAVLWYRDG